MLQLENRLNFAIKLLSLISALSKRYLSIYKQIKVTNCNKKKTKSFRIVQTIANIPFRAITSSF